LTLLVAVLSAVVGSYSAAAKSPSARQLREQQYVETAVLKGINGPACVPEHVAATNVGAPPASLLSILGVLRLPTTPADRLSLRFLAHESDVYVNYIRYARTAFGRRWYVWVAGPPQAFLPPANISGCLAAQTADFQQELASIPKALRNATSKMFDVQIRGERRNDARPPRPPGLTLFGLTPGGGGGGGGDATAAVIEQQGSWGSSSGGTGANPGLTLFSGVVPDGVATVTLRYPAGKIGGFSRRTGPAVTIKAHAVNNVVVVNVPRAGEQATSALTTTWRAANGTIIKIIHGNL
jgi:hypothetical protein